MRKRNKILIDLDGVLNTYNGTYNENNIPEIKEGAKEFLTDLSNDYEIILFTSRNKILSSKWLIENGIDKYISDITDRKELSLLYIDDRCIRFEGNYKKLREEINKFKTWYS